VTSFTQHGNMSFFNPIPQNIIIKEYKILELITYQLQKAIPYNAVSNREN